MKIVVLDGYTLNPGDLSWESIKAFGELTVYDRTPVDDAEEIVKRIGDAEIVFTNKTPLSAEIFTRCPGMKFVGVLATGYNVVDIEAAKKAGVPVCNVPVYGTSSVSQFAIALLLELCHHIGHHDATVKAGKWQNCADFCYWDYPLYELDGKTLGVIGLGKIGVHTAKIAGALGMRVIAYDPYPSDAGRAEAEYVEFDALLAQADAICIHMPLVPFSEGLINKENIAKMKDGVLLVNNSRGQIVVEKDLADALNAGKVGGAALDVVSTEPIRGDNPLLTAKNCIITPHISWAPIESRERIMQTSAQNLKSFLDGSPVNVVNK